VCNGVHHTGVSLKMAALPELPTGAVNVNGGEIFATSAWAHRSLGDHNTGWGGGARRKSR
jgi:hypothetical protein